MTYQVLNGQTIYDVALATYGDVSFVYQLIQDNPMLVNIDTTPPVNLIITWNPLLVTKIPSAVASSLAIAPITSEIFKSVQGMSIYDICMQVYGTLDYLYKLIQDSGFSNSQTYPLPGTSFIFNPTLAVSALFNSWLNKNNIIINTGSKGAFTVFSNVAETVIFTSEDGSEEFTPES